MKAKSLSKLALGMLLLGSAVVAQATPITYYLKGVTFSDGTGATGSFVFDADSKKSSGFSITTTPGLLTGFAWTNLVSGLYYGGGAGPNNFTLITFDGRRVFNFSFIDALTNAGGTDLLNTASTYECYNCSPFRRVNAGSVSSVVAAVPEPGTLALLLPVLAGVAWTRRRRSQFVKA